MMIYDAHNSTIACKNNNKSRYQRGWQSYCFRNGQI